jgi:DNA repair protein RadD
MKMQLRPYQKDIVNQVIKSDKSTLIQIPTGGGKTFIARAIIIDLINHYNKQILFVAPKVILMEQTREEFEGIIKPHGIVHGTNKYDKNQDLLISTLQTASRRKDLNPDVIIIDEIHYGFDGVMIEKLIKNKPKIRIIGLSATPYDKNGRLLQGFDLVLDQYDMKYMIKSNYLVPLKSYALTKPDLHNVKIIAGDYDLKELGQVVCNKNMIMEIVETTKSYIEKSKKTIVFAVDIEHAELLCKAYNKVGFKAKILHSKLSKNERAKEIESF